MHKKRQAQTRRGKLHGLTKSEARARTIKGWITKHARYRYGSTGPHRSISPRFRKVAEERQKRFEEKLHKHLESQPWWNDLTAEERQVILNAEFEHVTRGVPSGLPDAAGQHHVDPNVMSDAVWRAYQIEQARYWAEHNSFKDKAFENYLSKLPHDQQQAFKARGKRLVEIENAKRHKVIEVDDAEHVVNVKGQEYTVGGSFDMHLQEGGTRTPGQAYSHTGDEAYVQTDSAGDWQALVLARLSSRINNDPNRRTNFAGEYAPTFEDQVLGMTSNVPRGREARTAADRAAAAKMRAEVDKLLGPGSGDLLKDIPENSPGSTQGNSEERLERRLLGEMWKSHTAPTPRQRAQATERARRLLSRAAQAAGEAHEHQATRDAFIAMDKKMWSDLHGARAGRVETKEGSIIHTQAIPQDPRFEVGFKRRRKEGRIDRHLAYEPTTVESLYEDSRHYDKSLPLKERLRRHADFLVEQREAQIRGLASGTASWAYQDGKIVPLTEKTERRVDWGMSPNTEYVYTLNSNRKDAAGNYLPPYEKKVNVYDRGTRFDIGRRREAYGQTWKRDEKGEILRFKVDEKGKFVTDKQRVYQGDTWYDVDSHEFIQVRPSDPDYDKAKPMKVFSGVRGLPGTLLEGQRDEIAVDSEGRSRVSMQRKYEDRTAYDAPEYRPLSRYRDKRKPEGVDEVVYIPVKGATGQTQTVESATEHKTTYYHKGPGSAWRHSKGYDWIPDRRAYIVSKEDWDELPENEQDISRVPKTIQFKYLDPSMMHQTTAGRVHLQVGERTVFTNLKTGATRTDVLSPYFETKSRHEFARRAQDALVEQRKYEAGVFGDRGEHLYRVMADPNVTPEKALRAAMELERIKQDTDITPDEHAKSLGFKGIEEMKLLAGAGAATGILNQRRQIKEGYLPKAVNRSVNSLRKIKRIDRWAEGHSWDEELMTVNEAYTRPLQEKAANFGYGLQHPLSSPYGSSYGIDWGQFRYRQKWISDTNREMRRLDRSVAMVERQKRAIQRVRKGRQIGGIRGKFYNWMSEPVLRQQEGFNDMAQRHLDLIDEYKGKTAAVYDPLYGAHIRNKDGSLVTTRVPLRVQRHAEHRSARIQRMMQDEQLRGPIPNHMPGEKLATRLANINWAEHVKSTGTNPFVIGGAVLGAAAIGHYAYYKHKQRQLPESERVAYYNHILPGKFDATVPHLRTTRVYKTGDGQLAHLTGFANRRIPVAFAVGTHKTEVALRPMDRGLDPNARIFGSIRSGKVKGGRLTDSVIYENSTNAAGTKWARRGDHGTHDIYIGGKRVPGRFDFGNGWNKVERSSKNPHKLSQRDREEILWATAGTDMEEATKQFFRESYRKDKILDMFEDPEVVRNIRRKRGEQDASDIVSKHKSFVGSASESPPRGEASTRGMENAGFYSSIGTSTAGETRRTTNRMEEAFMSAADVNSPEQQDLTRNRRPGFNRR